MFDNFNNLRTISDEQFSNCIEINDNQCQECSEGYSTSLKNYDFVAEECCSNYFEKFYYELDENNEPICQTISNTCVGFD